MDALPIHEATERTGRRASGRRCTPAAITAMLLGAAKYLVGRRKFRGTVALIFQPAQEVELRSGGLFGDGFLDGFRISQVLGMHTGQASM
ncbi:M20/M25/M40 family metallo-hydrolase [Mesorhizobium sp.]|uniref:M20/M25/M40 family metallo-hydrolase n=1 Tax=Mesorhizobium sp. TaxID=1871066 RepID=UPI00345A3CD4